MNRLIAGVLVFIVGTAIYVSMGANNNSAPATPLPPDLIGKVVIFDRDGWTSTVSENVRFTIIGQNSFLVFARLKSDAEQFDYWVPLNTIKGLKVFDNLEDAMAHDKKSNPSKYKSETATK